MKIINDYLKYSVEQGGNEKDYNIRQRTCVLVLTHRCNLNCIYCYQKHKTTKDMTLETAKAIIETEVRHVKASKNKEGVRFRLFGGEPLLRFDLIKELCHWAWDTINDANYDMVITTNGTLLDDDKKQWLELYKEKIQLVMSVDGKDNVQECNRGCRSSSLPIEFVLKTWPNMLNMTVSRQSLPTFANELIYFHEQHYHIDGKLVAGEDWQEGDGKIYEAQLNKIAEYYLDHPEVTPIYCFNETSFSQLTNRAPNEKFAKLCGAGIEIVAYDVDGKLYPCHFFIPNVHGKEDVLEDLKGIDFSDTSRFIDDQCMKCDILKLCKSCCGCNYIERGDVSRRDRKTCQMILAEAKVVSSYQIKKKMRNKAQLSSEELLILKYAVKCYQLCCDFERKFYTQNE
jgi:radical SAM protein with 4Fe4S-binding SPASM domain